MRRTRFTPCLKTNLALLIAAALFGGCISVTAQTTCICDPQQVETDSMQLVEFFNSMGGVEWEDHSGWATPGIPIGQWYGIQQTTEEGCVTCLDLDGVLLPSSLGICQVFTQDAPGNNLRGIWPEPFCLPCLSKLSLSSNNFGGQFPDLSCSLDLIEVYMEKTGILDTIPASFLNLSNLRIVNLGDNRLFGNIPPELPGRFNNLASLYLDNNDLSGLLPDFSVNPNLANLSIVGNKYTFQDLLPYFTQIKEAVSGFVYQDQDSVYIETLFTAGLGLPFTINLGIDDTVTTSTYKWYQNGVPFDTVFTNSYRFEAISQENIGDYHCEITNSIATDLTLFSRNIHIETCTPGILEISETLCPGETLDLGNGLVFGQDSIHVFRGAADNGCDSAIIVQLEYYNATLTLDTTICEGSSLSLGGMVYEEAGNYRDTLPGASVYGCDSILSISLFLANEETLGPADAGGDFVACDSMATLNASPPPAGTWGYWQAPDLVQLSDTADPSATISGLQPGANILWWYLAKTGCEPYDSAFVELYFEPKPIAVIDSFTFYEYEAVDANVVVNDTNLESLLDWEVTLLNGPERGTLTLEPDGRLNYVPDREHPGIQRAQYILSSSSCAGDTSEIIFNIRQNLDKEQPPNVITPNGDNYNDTFIIPALHETPTGYPNNKLLIYTKEGECVFEAEDYQNDWGGASLKGGPLPGGVYYFVFYYDYGKPRVERGSVLIIR